MKMNLLGLILGSVGVSAVAQFLLKLGMSRGLYNRLWDRTAPFTQPGS